MISDPLVLKKYIYKIKWAPLYLLIFFKSFFGGRCCSEKSKILDTGNYGSVTTIYTYILDKVTAQPIDMAQKSSSRACSNSDYVKNNN